MQMKQRKEENLNKQEIKQAVKKLKLNLNDSLEERLKWIDSYQYKFLVVVNRCPIVSLTLIIFSSLWVGLLIAYIL